MSVIENLESFEPRHYAHLYVKNVLFTSSAKLFLSSKISRSFAFKVFCMPSLILPKNVATLHVVFSLCTIFLFSFYQGHLGQKFLSYCRTKVCHDTNPKPIQVLLHDVRVMVNSVETHFQQ